MLTKIANGFEIKQMSSRAIIVSTPLNAGAILVIICWAAFLSNLKLLIASRACDLSTISLAFFDGRFHLKAKSSKTK